MILSSKIKSYSNAYLDHVKIYKQYRSHKIIQTCEKNNTMIIHTPNKILCMPLGILARKRIVEIKKIPYGFLVMYDYGTLLKLRT